MSDARIKLFVSTVDVVGSLFIMAVFLSVHCLECLCFCQCLSVHCLACVGVFIGVVGSLFSKSVFLSVLSINCLACVGVFVGVVGALFSMSVFLLVFCGCCRFIV